MHRFHILPAAAILVAAVAFASCTSEPTSPARLRGKLSIEVTVVDEDGFYMADRSGVTIKLEGTDRFATSAANGVATFDDLDAGIYDLTFSKPGHSIMKVYGSQFVGGGTAYLRDIYITELPTYSLADFTAAIDSTSSLANEYVVISGTATAPAPVNAARRIRVYMDTSAALTAEQGHYLTSASVTISAGESTFRHPVSLADLRYDNVASGTKVYVVGYPAAVRSVGYYNPNNQEWYEGNLGLITSPVVSFRMP